MPLSSGSGTVRAPRISSAPGTFAREKASRTVYIAGAGIAGMTLALALARFDMKVVILEKNPGIQTEGAGLQISPNARHVLNRLDLDAALQQTGFEPQAIDVYPFHARKPLISLQMGDIANERFGAPYIVIHRADLADALHAACRRFANIDIQFSIRNFDMQTHARGLSVTYELKSGDYVTARPFAFVGADGVHSPTRTRVLAGPPATYSGYVAWRALVPVSLLDSRFNLERTSLLWAPGFHAVTYPHPHRHLMNIALFSKEKLDRRTRVKRVEAPTIPETVFSSPRISAILAAAEAGWQKWPLYAVSTPRWYKGPVGLIGDAAHAMLPYQAQGAAMAIEDAGVLAPLLARCEHAEQAFQTCYQLRRRRVQRVVKTSATNGIIYHAGWPLTIARNLVVKLQGPTGHLKRLAWIYGHDVATDTQ
ncbi:MAG TPA: FAD-binding protein [Devosia sp.]|nr:FAD-binding protein [Devosia sp.]